MLNVQHRERLDSLRFPTRETSGTSRQAPVFKVRGSLLKAMMSQSRDKKRQRTLELGEEWGNYREAASVCVVDVFEK